MPATADWAAYFGGCSKWLRRNRRTGRRWRRRRTERRNSRRNATSAGQSGSARFHQMELETTANRPDDVFGNTVAGDVRSTPNHVASKILVNRRRRRGIHRPVLVSFGPLTVSTGNAPLRPLSPFTAPPMIVRWLPVQVAARPLLGSPRKSLAEHVTPPAHSPTLSIACWNAWRPLFHLPADWYARRRCSASSPKERLAPCIPYDPCTSAASCRSRRPPSAVSHDQPGDQFAPAGPTRKTTARSSAAAGRSSPENSCSRRNRCSAARSVLMA